MSIFKSDWIKESKTPFSSRVAETLNPTPLRDKTMKTIYNLTMVRKKLEDSRLRMEQKHKMLFNKCVQSQEIKDSTTAIMYANECAQVRKIVETVNSSQLAIDQVILRLETVLDFGDIGAEIMPAAGVIRSVKNRLAGVIPEVSFQLGAIGQTLDGMVLEIGEATGHTWSGITLGDEANKILEEASAVAEDKIKEGFPTLPSQQTSERRLNSSN